MRRDENFLHDHFEVFVAVYGVEYVSSVVADGVLTYGDTFVEEMMKAYPEARVDILTLVAPCGETFAQGIGENCFPPRLFFGRNVRMRHFKRFFSKP